MYCAPRPRCKTECTVHTVLCSYCSVPATCAALIISGMESYTVIKRLLEVEDDDDIILLYLTDHVRTF